MNHRTGLTKNDIRQSSRSYYFGAGPACLPEDVLQVIQDDCREWQGSQVSILEIGHRTKAFNGLMEQLEALFRELANVPSHYHVLFMSCPTRAHFGLIPLHFLDQDRQAGYWVTGYWSKMAFDEAIKLKRACHQISGTPQSNTAYLYCTPNETMEGMRSFPNKHVISVPIVADMTSCLLTEPIPIQDYAMVFAGAQKTLSTAGLSLVLIDPHFLATACPKSLPTYLDYRTYANKGSLCVTPPIFNCGVMLRQLEWIKKQGGITKLHAQNVKKAALLYEYIDSTPFYLNPVPNEARSLVNVVFFLQDKTLEPLFFEAAKAHGLLGLEGHRVVGGVRASLYNAMPLEGVESLIELMKSFSARYG